MSGEVPHDGFCPRCKALADEACHVGRRAVPDHRVRHPMPAPAVPVGVQPEPAERPDNWLGEPHGRLYPLHCGECWDRSQGRDGLKAAVPVVHPEPGDRVREWSFATMDQYLLPKARQDAWDAVREQAGEEWLAANFQMVDAALWNAAPAIVAAAVAAVRADLAAEVAARIGYGPTEEFRSGRSRW